MTSIPVITLDGPTASGKGTIAQRIATTLGFHYLDSGALYRLTALASERAGVALDDVAGLAAIARNLDIRFEGEQIFLAGEPVESLIRAEAIGNRASALAVHTPVREALTERQRAFCQAPGLVADGRDMGTVIFPNAGLKVFLTASAEARALRRYKQLIDKGFSAKLDSLTQDLRERDARDANRAVAPLKPAQGAHVLDSSDLSIEATVAQVLAWYAEVQAKA